MGGEKLSLPRKKDWKEGQHQIALYIRMPSGSYIYIDVNSGSEDEVRDAIQLLQTMSTAAGARHRRALPPGKEPPP